MSFEFSERSLAILSTVDERLQLLAHEALELSPADFAIVSGRRTEAEQERLVAAGKSLTMNSKHLTGRAIDIMPYVDREYITNGDHISWIQIHRAFRRAAERQKLAVRWGGLWISFYDPGHYELIDEKKR